MAELDPGCDKTEKTIKGGEKKKEKDKEKGFSRGGEANRISTASLPEPSEYVRDTGGPPGEEEWTVRYGEMS